MRVFLIAIFVLHLPAYASDFDCSSLESSLGAGISVLPEEIAPCVSQLSDEELAAILETLVTAKLDGVAAGLISVIAPQRPTPPVMHLAVGLDQVAVVTSLLERDRSVLDRTDETGYAPIVIAALASAERVAAVLLEYGAMTDLGEALVIASGRSIAVAKTIIEHHGSLLTDPIFASRVLSEAARVQKSEFVQYLLHHSADPRLMDNFGHSVAFAAPHNKDEKSGLEIWSLLIRGGANVKKDICVFDEETLAQIDANMPDWFTREVTTIRLDCVDN